MTISCIFGHRYGKVDGKYQYCENCGYARPVPCKHNWETNKEIEHYWGSDTNTLPMSYTKVLQCRNCGNVKTVKL